MKARALALLAASLAIACAAKAGEDDASRLARARGAMRSGAYDSAAALFASLSASTDAKIARAARRGHVRALAERGRYDDAERIARGYVGAGKPDALVALGEVVALRGRLAEAESLFVRASVGSPDSLVARLRAAEMRLARGDREGAMRVFDRFIDSYNERRARLSSEELAAVARACRHLGSREPQLFKDALRAYDEAVAADSGNIDARVELGELFLEKYNGPDARATFASVLRENPSHPRALLGVARALQFDGAPGADSLVRRSLAVNERLVEARLMLARVRLDAEEYEDAEREARRALEVDPGSPSAHALIAGSRYLRRDRAGFDEAMRRALERDPKSPLPYVTLAEVAARNRLYGEALDFARRAVALDSASASALGTLGMSELRLGRFDEARAHLERAFAGDPYHVWIKNTLDLLDTFKEYKETRTARFHLIIYGKESDLLAPYLLELLEDGFQKMAARYGYEPPTPIRLEVYRSHGDFSVRTVGLPGLGALGVSFGSVLAMHSPSARRIGDFNWGSTVWHELAHAFTLGMTGHRIPRWLSEGISVYEERRARAGWGQDATLGFLVAYASGRMPPVSKLNDAFTRPSFPEQIMLAYYQASLVCEMIDRERGPAALPALLRAIAGGASLPTAVRRTLGWSPAELDMTFDAYVRRRFATQLAATAGNSAGRDSMAAKAGAFGRELTEARALIAQGRSRDAVPHLERAKALFPEYAEQESPYRQLAAIFAEAGDVRRAAAELSAQVGLNETDYEANLQLASLLEQLGDRTGAAAALERAVFISPYDPAVHVRLATLFSLTGDRGRAVRERRAVVALDPADRADARYQLARALFEAGDRAGARREVLSALEEAPNFEQAQALLLELRQAAGAKP